MTIALLFTVLLILWIISVLSGWPGKPLATNIILAVLLILLGWQVFGPLLKT